MVTWNTVYPDGAKSVKANGVIGLQNTDYITTIMGSTDNDTTNDDSIRDHYWNVDSNLDGRHRYVNMPEYTIAGDEEDPVLGASMGGTVYCKRKTATESPDQQDVQPFFRNTDNIMQILGMHACCTFTGRTTNGVCELEYAHNITSVTRISTGQYDVVMTNDLPSVNYLMYGGAIRNDTFNRATSLTFRSAAISSVKAVNSMSIMTANIDNASLQDVLQGWFFCFGG